MITLLYVSSGTGLVYSLFTDNPSGYEEVTDKRAVCQGIKNKDTSRWTRSHTAKERCDATKERFVRLCWCSSGGIIVFSCFISVAKRLVPNAQYSSTVVLRLWFSCCFNLIFLLILTGFICSE